MREEILKAFGCFLLTTILLIPLFASQEGYYRYQFARVKYVQGDVLLQKGEGEEEAAEVNFVIAEGNILTTREGRAEVSLGRGNELRIDGWSRVEFIRLPQNRGDKTRLRLLEGSIYLRLRNLDGEKDYEVHTADASCYILEEGLYRFDVTSRETEFAAIEGAAEVAGDERSEVLERGERLVASKGDLGIEMRTPLERDSFAAWNEERDEQYASASTRYLPSELDEYEAELASNGRWVYERPWGYVWVPYVIYTDWRPYYYGRWVWYPVLGWTWVPYEPWGWCVFHFGRWHWRFGLGWYWIPTTYWGPAWVHWWSAYDYLGWVPLSYYNRPVVIVNNYFYDRFYDSTYPVYSRALTVIRKDQLRSPRVHEVALRETDKVRLGELSLRPVGNEELHSLVKPESLRALPANPAVSREKISSGSLSGASQEKIVRGEALRSGSRVGGVAVTPQKRLNQGGEEALIRPARTQVERAKVSANNEERRQGVTVQGTRVLPDERRIREEGSSLSGVRVSPSPVKSQNKDSQGSSSSRTIRKKDEEKSPRPSRVTSSYSSSERIFRGKLSSSPSARTSPTSYLRSKLAERVYPSRRSNIAWSGSTSGLSSSGASSWRLPSVTRLPSLTVPRASSPSFSSGSRGLASPRISSPGAMARSSTPPSSGKVIKKK